MLVATYNLAIIEDYFAGNAKIKISIKKIGVVVIFGEPWQLLLTGSAVPRITHTQSSPSAFSLNYHYFIEKYGFENDRFCTVVRRKAVFFPILWLIANRRLLLLFKKKTNMSRKLMTILKVDIKNILKHISLLRVI